MCKDFAIDGSSPMQRFAAFPGAGLKIEVRFAKTNEKYRASGKFFFELPGRAIVPDSRLMVVRLRAWHYLARRAETCVMIRDRKSVV